MRKPRVAVAAVAAMFIIPLASCAVDEGAPVEGVGKVTIACGNVEDLCEIVIAEYTKATGNDADYVRMSGGEILARLESSRGAANAEFDIWWGGPAETFATGADRDLLEAYKSPARSTIQSHLMDAEGYWTGYSINPNGLCSNTAVLGKLGVAVPTTWQELLNPKLKENVGTSHPATAGTGFSFLATMVAINELNEDAAYDFMLKMHPNVLQYTKSGAAPVQMLVRGEIATAPAYMSVCERERVVNGNKDIVMTYPTEGVGVEIGATAIVAGAKNLEGAKAFIDWSLTQAALDAHISAGYNVFPPFLAGGGNGLGQDVSDIQFSEFYDPVKLGEQRTRLAERFDREIAPAPVD